MALSSFLNKNNAIIGIILTIIGIIAPIAYSSYQNKDTLKKVKTISINELKRELLSPDEQFIFGKVVQYYIDGKKYNRLMKSMFQIKNTGNEVISPQDFYKNIKVTTPNDLNIVNIQNIGSVPAGLDLKWEKISEKEYYLQPLLLNPGDSFLFTITMNPEAPKKVGFSDFDNTPIANWSVRITGAPDIKIKNIYDNQLVKFVSYSSPESISEMFKGNSITYELSYKSLPLIIVLTFLFSILTILVLNKVGAIDTLRPKILFLVILSVGFSISTSEIISYYIFGSKFASEGDKYINVPLLLMHLFVLIFFIIKKYVFSPKK